MSALQVSYILLCCSRAVECLKNVQAPASAVL